MEQNTSKGALLLVEDNEDDVFIMRRALKEAGVKNSLYVTEDGQIAIDYLNGNGHFNDRANHPLPEVVFLDLKLPLKSGHEVLAWIREQESLKSTVVVILTSSEEPADVSKSYSLGANSYLVKPPTVDKLVELARSFKWYWLQHNRFDPT